jgi:hypothetical protein
MATNEPDDIGRVGEVLHDAREQDPHTAQWTRRDTQHDRFRGAKRAGGTLNSVRRED